MTLLSILIPTLTRRRASFTRMMDELSTQIARDVAPDEAEVLSLVDDGELSIGAKRNRLLAQARGAFVVSVDDDDGVHESYVRLIVDAIRQHPDVDCFGMKCAITFRGQQQRMSVYSLRYREYRWENGVYVRPPQHFTPIRREIAARYRFADVSYSEDYDWALQMWRDGALRTEHFIDEVLYHYHTRRRYEYQWLLDRTQTLRHALGLQRVNRVRFQRWWNQRLKGAQG